MRNWLVAAALALTLALAAHHGAVAQTVLDETLWAGDADCYIRNIYFYADGFADIDFGDDDFDVGFWYLAEDDRVVFIEFEYFYDTFVAIFDGTYIRAAHAFTFEDEDSPFVELCTFYRQ